MSHQKKELKNRINDQIRISPIRVIDWNGNQLGVISTEDALKIAKEQELDLVEIAPQAKPPVCKIIDWGKFQYQESKKKQRSKSNQQKVETKGIRIRPAIGENDFLFKLKQAEGFLKKGKKVKIEMVLRGREKAFSDQAKEKLKLFIDKIDFPIKIEQEIGKQFNGFSSLVAPNSEQAKK